MQLKTTSSIIAIALGTVAMAAPAAAQNVQNIQQVEVAPGNSTAKITQDGTDNKADGSGEDSFTLFDGSTLEFAPQGTGIYQDGSGSSSTIDQVGKRNVAAIDQSVDGDGTVSELDRADSSTATIIQGESGNIATDSVAYIDQTGDSLTATIEQNGARNTSIAWQVGNVDGTVAANTQSHKINGKDNRTEIIQRDEDGDAYGNEADITISTNENEGYILQAANSDKAQVDIIGGNGNYVEIRQLDSVDEGNNVDVDIDGKLNDVVIRQSGLGGQHEATVTQTGNELSANIDQSDPTVAGEGNLATVNQKGENSSADITQAGEGGGNKAQVAQEGAQSDALAATITQGGMGGLNEADIDQTGKDQTATIDQSGSGGGSIAGIDQSTDGTKGNEATITQIINAASGTDNADIDQGGNENVASVTQTRDAGGTGNTASITMPGNKNNASIEQTGYALKGDISLNGRDNMGDIVQSAAGGSSEASISTGSSARYNSAMIEQTSGGNIASIDQITNYNEGTITQDNPDYANGTNNADIDQSGGNYNVASITQSGPGTSRTGTVGQDGTENEVTLNQNGDGNSITANITQAGNRNRVELTQTATGGNNLNATFSQDGDDNVILYTQEGYALGATVEQNGDDNFVDVSQTGNGYDVSITQNGNGLSFTMSYTGPASGGGGYTVTQTD